MSVLGGGGSRSAQREPPANRRLLTTFPRMDNHIGEKLSYSGPMGSGVCTHVNSGGKICPCRDSNSGGKISSPMLYQLSYLDP